MAEARPGVECPHERKARVSEPGQSKRRRHTLDEERKNEGREGPPSQDRRIEEARKVEAGKD